MLLQHLLLQYDAKVWQQWLYNNILRGTEWYSFMIRSGFITQNTQKRFIYKSKSQWSGSFLVLVVLHLQAQTCSEAALMRSISLHSLSLGTRMFPLDQLGSKRIGSPSWKQPWVEGWVHCSFTPPLLCCQLHSPPWETRGHVMATKKTLFADLTPVSTVTGAQRLEKYSLDLM